MFDPYSQPAESSDSRREPGNTMNTSRSERYRPIKAEEIANWYGTSLKPVLIAEQFDAIAKAINGWWWPGDEPPADASPETEAASRKYMEEAIYLWDFKQVTKAAKTLLDSLCKTGIFGGVAGDFRRLAPCNSRFGSPETKSNGRNAGISGPISRFLGSLAERRTAWLGREDSNLRMGESKSPALPLGDAPKLSGKRRDGPCRAFLLATPVYRGT